MVASPPAGRALRVSETPVEEILARQGPPSVLGCHIGKRIGGGGFSVVYVGIEYATQKRLAVKVISLKPGTPKAPTAVLDQRLLREVRIHESLKHRNVIELFRHEGDSRDGPGRDGWGGPAYFIALELADEGDLFDKIAPNHGIDEPEAHFFFLQLVAGLSYIHSVGIAHRDLKPENVLLATSGDIKISDYGLSSVFKLKGKERALSDACGSPPYVAPELALGRPYKAEPIDVWSLGILLFTLLVGNTPWDIPTEASPEYAAYLTGELFRHDPWTRLSRDQLSLLMKMLNPDPARRITLKQVKAHRWVHRNNAYLGTQGQCEYPHHLSHALLVNLQRHGHVDIPTAEEDAAAMALDEQIDGKASFVVQPASSPPMAHPSSLATPSVQPAMLAAPSATMPNATIGTLPTMRLYTRASHVVASQRGSNSLTYFASHAPALAILEAVGVVLQQRGAKIVPTALAPHEIDPQDPVRTGDGGMLNFNLRDRRRQALQGVVVVRREFGAHVDAATAADAMDDDGADEVKTYAVAFRRMAGSPVEWRDLYVNVVGQLPAGMVAAK